jgi:WD40 repeat protein
VAFLPGDSALAIGNENGAVSIVSLPDGEVVRRLKIPGSAVEGILEEPPGRVESIAISPAASHLAVVEEDGALLVWDLAAEDEGAIHISPPHKIFSASFSPDGRYLLASGGNFDISVQIGGGDARVNVRNIGGVLLVKDLKTDEVHQAGSGAMVFESAFWDRDSRGIRVLGNSLPFREGMTKRLVTFSVESIVGAGEATVLTDTNLGRGPMFTSKGFDPAQGLFLLELGESLYGWTVGGTGGAGGS